ncbi:hypothetical protein KUTeg_009916 [Tegillarca granosa]|uniref:C1q domain-containing protein n=1 Tax=Tegillarca granosa TaxID=220873 RepID=A0ABQ9F585_TEGGR|nr:hypothetical protein KUTeg_009916 [Tegillarca granosa]
MTFIYRVSNRVAFSAWNVVDFKNLGYHQPIVYKSVLINVGNSYHQTTGIFSPIIPSVYVFYYSIIVAPNVNLNTALVGNMVIVYLNDGDNVWVRIETTHLPVSDDIGSIENSFSVFLLFSDNSQ